MDRNADILSEILTELRGLRADINALRAHLGDREAADGRDYGPERGRGPSRGHGSTRGHSSHHRSARSHPFGGRGMGVPPEFDELLDYLRSTGMRAGAGMSNLQEMFESFFGVGDNDSAGDSGGAGRSHGSGSGELGPDAGKRGKRRAAGFRAEPADDEPDYDDPHDDGLDRDFDDLDDEDVTVDGGHQVGGVDISRLIDEALREREERRRAAEAGDQDSAAGREKADGDDKGAAASDEDSEDDNPYGSGA